MNKSEKEALAALITNLLIAVSVALLVHAEIYAVAAFLLCLLICSGFDNVLHKMRKDEIYQAEIEQLKNRIKELENHEPV